MIFRFGNMEVIGHFDEVLVERWVQKFSFEEKTRSKKIGIQRAVSRSYFCEEKLTNGQQLEENVKPKIVFLLKSSLSLPYPH